MLAESFLSPSPFKVLKQGGSVVYEYRTKTVLLSQTVSHSMGEKAKNDESHTDESLRTKTK